MNDITVNWAYYGSTPSTPNCIQFYEVTNLLQTLINASPTVTINNSTMGGDPSVGNTKGFCASVNVNGSSNIFICAEGGSIDFSSPSNAANSGTLIVNPASNAFLAIGGGNVPAFTNPVEFLEIGTNFQMTNSWQVIPVTPATSPASYYIVLQSNPSLCLDIVGTSASNAVGLVLSKMGKPNFTNSNTWLISATPPTIQSAAAPTFALDAGIYPTSQICTMNGSSFQNWQLLQIQ